MTYCLFNDFAHYDVKNNADVIGKLDDVYLDDESWKIKWFVVETGHWFSSNKVLLDATQIINLSPESAHIEVVVTKEDIENAPSADEHPPVSDQRSAGFIYYAATNDTLLFPGYAGLMLPTTLVERPAQVSDIEKDAASQIADRHLRSAREMDGYTVSATDGTLGPVSDFVINSESWSIDLIALDTSKWLPDRTVVISPHAVDKISWEGRKVLVSMDKDTIKRGPELSSLKEIQSSYITRVNEYYRFPIY